MALCFLDEEENIVAKKDTKVTWKLELPKDKPMVKDIIVMDEVEKIISYNLKLEIDEGAIRELLDRVERITE